MAGGVPSRGEEQQRPAASFDPCFEPVAAAFRAEHVESVHRGAAAVVDQRGQLLGCVGDPAAWILLRSTAKPFQAAAVVASGAAETRGLSDEEIAVMAGSHRGRPEHVEAVTRLLERACASPASLVCGSVEHMCSGKHAGMLLLAAHLGCPPAGYERSDHPVQKEIGAFVASLLADGPGARRCGLAGRERDNASRTLFAGTDGCGVPVIGMSLQEAAWLFALLAAGVTPALARVRDAMLAHPMLVAGEGRLDTTLLRAGAGGMVAKGGAEGMQGMGLVPAAGADRGEGQGAIGFALKVEDGSGRCAPVIAATFLRAWGRAAEAASVEASHSPVMVDTTGREVARIVPLVELQALRRVPQAGGVAAAGGEGAAAGLGAAAGSAPRAGGADEAGIPAKRPFWGRERGQLTISRGDEKEVRRFLREQWPSVDREYFGHPVEWVAEPYALVYRRDRRIIAVLRGHFVGGLASVDELMVRDGQRGRGMGSLLLGRFEEEARSRRCSRVVLRAVKGSPAEDFYRKRGYHRECVQFGYEFGYDYVRLVCATGPATAESKDPAGEGKGER